MRTDVVKSPDAGFLKRLGWRGFVGILIAVVALVFVIQNKETVNVQILTWTFSVWLWLVLVVFFVLGMLLDGVVRRVIRNLRGKPG